MTWQYNKLLTLGIILLLAGCQGMYGAKQGDEGLAPTPEVEPLPPAPAPEPNLTFKQYQRRAIDSLQVGDVEAAHSDLNKALAQKPRNRLVKSLLAQIDDKNPRRTLGRDYFEYTVQAGDTLSTIADKFLGDSMQFYILARYNGINNPSMVFVGQTIKVPSRSSSPPAAEDLGETPATDEQTAAETVAPIPTPEPVETEAAVTPQGEIPPVEDTGLDSEQAAEIEVEEPPPAESEAPQADTEASTKSGTGTGTENAAAKQDILTTANDLYQQQRYADAVGVLTAAAAIPQAGSPEQRLLVDSYKGMARQFEAEGELDQARDTLEKAAEIAPQDDDLASALAGVADKIEAQRLYDLAQEQIEDNQLEAAYQSLNEVLVYQPGHPQATQQAETIKQQMVQEYHRKAMQFYRKRELDQAIEYWDKVLALDPSHEYAQSYRIRALELKQKLDQL